MPRCRRRSLTLYPDVAAPPPRASPRALGTADHPLSSLALPPSRLQQMEEAIIQISLAPCNFPCQLFLCTNYSILFI